MSTKDAKIIGLVGLPGSGKSTYFSRAEFAQFLQKDDIGAAEKHNGKGWQANENDIRAAIKSGQSAIFSDIELCYSGKRNECEARLGTQIEWIYFENEPWKCALNCLYRFYFKNSERPLHTEIRKIKRLSSVYQILTPILTVENTEVKSDAWKCAVSCLHRFYYIDDGVEENENYGSLKPDIAKIKSIKWKA